MCDSRERPNPPSTEGWEPLMSQLSGGRLDYYKVLEVEYDATEETIRSMYLRLALKWHPDKHKGDAAATLKFQEISEAYHVLSDRTKREEYDLRGNYDVGRYSLQEYLNRFQSLILTANGLGLQSFPSRFIKHN